MGCPVCQSDMIKSKVGYLCLNCGNLVTHGHSAIKPDHHEHEAHHAHDAHPAEHHEPNHEVAPHHHEAVHHEVKPAAKKSSSTTVSVSHRTVSDIKRKAH